MNNDDANDIYKIAFESLAGAIIISPMDGSWIYANRAALKLYGMTLEELSLGVKGIFEKVHSDDLYVKEMNDLIDGKIDSFTITKITKLTGGNKWFKNEVSRSSAPNGSTYIIANVTDVSELVEYKNRLEEKVEELTKMNSLMVDRELAMIELKNKLKSLES